MLFIEYDVHPSGQIELVALINAVEEDGLDPDGAAWLTWRSRRLRRQRNGLRGRSPRRSRADGETDDAAELRAIVEAHHSGGPCHQGGGAVVSTTRSQLYRLARDLGNVEAVEHGYKRGGLSGAAGGARNARHGASSTGRGTARSTASSAPSASDRGGSGATEVTPTSNGREKCGCKFGAVCPKPWRGGGPPSSRDASTDVRWPVFLSVATQL